MQKTIKILGTLLMVIILITITTNVFAAEAKGQAIDPADLSATYSTDDSGLTDKAGQIMGMIRNVAAIAAVIIIMVLGVKYMLGSVEEKAEYKKSFIPLIVGIVLVVAATAIAAFIFNMAE